MILLTKQLLEYLGGVVDTPPNRFPIGPDSVWWGLWWGLLLVVIMIFCGQSSKFIYIDF
jgi:hypothetical protein